MSRPFCFCRIVLLLIPVILNLVPAASVQASDLPANFQLGRIPLFSDGGGWSVALPLNGEEGQWHLVGPSSQLGLIPSPVDDKTWLVFEPREPGPVSALLTLQDSSGEILRRSVVAGEVVFCQRDDPPTLLIVTGGAKTIGRRYLRLEGLPPATNLSLPGARAELGDRNTGGWQLIEVQALPGCAEASGRLKLGANNLSIPVQVSAEESITILAQASLPTGWRYRRFVPLRERLYHSSLRARVGMFGVRADARILRLFDLSFDTASGRQSLTRIGRSELPSIRSREGFNAVGIRFARANKVTGSRLPYLVSLTGERAHLIDPNSGWLNTVRSMGLRSTGAVVASRIHRNSLYCLRRDADKGEVFLRRWQGRFDENLPLLRGRLSPRSLQSRLGREQVVPFALAVRRDASTWPENPVRENLLLLAASGNDPDQPLPVSLFSLRMDVADPSRIASIRRRYTSEIRHRIGDPNPSLNVVSSPRINGNGYPMGVRIGHGQLQTGEIINIPGAGAAFEGPYYVEGVSHRFQGTGFSLDPAHYLRMDHDGQNTLLQRYRMVDGRRQVRAAGTIAGVRGLALRTSVRERHGWALTAMGSAGLDDPHQLRFLGPGFPEGINLPPRVDAGADLRSSDGRLQLRARVIDANDDALSVRWSAPGVEFTDPTNRQTGARFPVGVTQVRVRTREMSGRYESRDIMHVTVASASPVNESPTLTTSLRGLFPNPANPRVRIAFTVGRRGTVRLRVYDVAGRLVRNLLDEVRGAGAYDVDWDGTDDSGSAQSSGIYLVHLDSPEGGDRGRVVLIR